jgi:ABC-type transport system involved in cytochrome c biogenesis permease subunit
LIRCFSGGILLAVLIAVMIFAAAQFCENWAWDHKELISGSLG